MDYTGYLFVHFTGEHKDGEQGVRDPFLIRSQWGKDGKQKYYLIATDLRIEAGKGCFQMKNSIWGQRRSVMVESSILPRKNIRH